MFRSDVQLVRRDGTTHNQIRGDCISRGTLVIEEDGRFFIRTWRWENGFRIYREDHRVLHYESDGA